MNDIVTGTIAGMVAGAVGAMFVPNPPFLDLILGGGIAGLVSQMLILPVKWLLNSRPDASDETQSNGKDQDHEP
ncbi:MAG TPA: hypothetical protein VEK79_14110 [Thermoanaerobaculia bacterium]|nr:hypothetical protein [Thermoanaerobaculia bacterium]